jgi:thioredoxin 2
MTIVKCIKCGANNRVDETAAKTSKPVCGKCAAELDLSAAQTAGDGKPIIVTDASFADAITSAGNIPILVDCWAPWCGPCRVVGPILDQLSAESGGKYKIAKLNVDENPRTSAQFGIQSIPTMIIFKNGKEVDRLVGAQPKPAIASRLRGFAAG